MWKNQGSWNSFHAKLIPNSRNNCVYLRKECLLNLSLTKKYISKTWRGYLLFHAIKVQKVFDMSKENEEFCRGLVKALLQELVGLTKELTALQEKAVSLTIDYRDR